MVITLSLPDDCEVLVKAGQNVDFQTPLIKKKLGRDVAIPLAQKLKISPKEIFIALKKVIGERVHKGELLAEKKTLLKIKQYHSEVDGIIKEINHQDGHIILTIDSEGEEKITAFFKGSVAAISKNQLQIDLAHAKEFAAKEVSTDFGGEIKFLDVATLSGIAESAVEGKVVIDEKLKSFEQTKLEALQAKGIITLFELESKTSLPYARVKNQDDWQKIAKLTHKYCTVNKKNSTIYFYE